MKGSFKGLRFFTSGDKRFLYRVPEGFLEGFGVLGLGFRVI